MHFYAWKSGLKTGMYYLRTKPAVDAIKFTLNVEELLNANEGGDINKVLKIISSQNINSEVDPNSNSTDPKKKNEPFKKLEKEKEEEGCISCSG